MKHSKILTAGVLALAAVLVVSAIIVATAPFIAAVLVITAIIVYINTKDIEPSDQTDIEPKTDKE